MQQKYSSIPKRSIKWEHKKCPVRAKPLTYRYDNEETKIVTGWEEYGFRRVNTFLEEPLELLIDNDDNREMIKLILDNEREGKTIDGFYLGCSVQRAGETNNLDMLKWLHKLYDLIESSFSIVCEMREDIRDEYPEISEWLDEYITD